MKRKILLIMFLAAATVVIGSCKRTYFQMTDVSNRNTTNRFVLKDAYYRMGKSIALTGGRFEITPGDSIVLFIEGQGKVAGVGEAGVAELSIAQTARFYISLPIRLSNQKYDIANKAICEITGSVDYSRGENLFVCQSGSVVIDSLKKDDVYGVFKGKYLNTSNKTFTVVGAFKAGLKQ